MTPDATYRARAYCPGCEPTADLLAEVLDVRYCEQHTPETTGAEDHRTGPATYLSGGAEAGGEGNRRWCQLLHRERKVWRPP